MAVSFRLFPLIGYEAVCPRGSILQPVQYELTSRLAASVLLFPGNNVAEFLASTEKFIEQALRWTSAVRNAATSVNSPIQSHYWKRCVPRNALHVNSYGDSLRFARKSGHNTFWFGMAKIRERLK